MDVSKFRLLVIAVMAIYFARANPPFEQDKTKVEEMFKEIHPDLSTLDLVEWDLVDNITREKLEKACRDVAVQVSPSFNVSQATYVPPTLKDELLDMERVVSYAPISFPRWGIRYMHMINCTFAEFGVYLCRGKDNNHVFCLTQDKKDSLFHLRSGQHEIHY